MSYFTPQKESLVRQKKISDGLQKLFKLADHGHIEGTAQTTDGRTIRIREEK